MNIGGNSNPLKLTGDFDVIHATLTFLNGSGGTIASADVVGYIPNNNPWDGFFLSSGQAAVFNNISGKDTETINLTFDMAATPEPASLTLLGTGAVGLIGYGWRKRKRAA
jgi:hypothetical protein